MSDAPLTNWAGNYTYRAARFHQPATLAELQALVARCRRVRAVGTRHSFNSLPDCAEDLVSLERLPPRLTLDHAQQTVTVSAAVRYGELAQALHAQGYALHNLASLPHLSVAGAVATGTHGSGSRHGNLATAVRALVLMTAEGDVRRLAPETDGELFNGAVVALGALGIVTELTLAVEPTFAVAQDVYEGLPLEAALAHFDELVDSAYSVSLFTDWRGPRINQVWVKRRVGVDHAAPPDLRLGAARATRERHPLPDHSAENCTPQLGAPGPWHERLPHFRLEYTPSNGAELQSEYLLPRRHAAAALQALAGLSAQIAPHLHISEIRTVAADELWLSPSYAQASVCLHFTWRPDWPAVSALLPVIEARLAPFGARPHWGKLFTLPPAQLRPLYPRLPDFQRLAARLDPAGKFRNAFVDAYLF